LAYATSDLLVKTGEMCAVGSNERTKDRGSSLRKNSSGVINLMPMLIARSLMTCQYNIKFAGKEEMYLSEQEKSALMLFEIAVRPPASPTK
jgi:hypothetical protein